MLHRLVRLPHWRGWTVLRHQQLTAATVWACKCASGYTLIRSNNGYPNFWGLWSLRTVGFRPRAREGTPRLELEFDLWFSVCVEKGGESGNTEEVIKRFYLWSWKIILGVQHVAQTQRDSLDYSVLVRESHKGAIRMESCPKTWWSSIVAVKIQRTVKDHHKHNLSFQTWILPSEWYIRALNSKQMTGTSESCLIKSSNTQLFEQLSYLS